MQASRRLVLGIGNDLRGDDALGLRIAEAIGTASPDLRVLMVRQLLPENAAQIAEVDEVIFVDAAVDLDAVTITALTPRETAAMGDAHRTDAQGLLDLTMLAYGCCPRAWLVAVPGASFELMDGLSTRALSQMEEALAIVRRLLAPPS